MSIGVDVKADTKKAERKLAEFGRALEPRPLLRHIGEHVRWWINENFRKRGAVFQSGGWPPLSPNTLANPKRGGKGSQPLRNTGRLAQSYAVKLEGDTAVRIGTDIEYAHYHEDGTKPYTIRPANKKVLFFWTAGGTKPYKGKGNTFARSVNHPGIPQRRMLPDDARARKLAKQAIDAYIEIKTRGAR